MILLPDKRIVYVDPTKTGSQSLDLIFKQLHRGQYIRIPNQSTDKHNRVIPTELADCEILASVRNPYERVFSLYKMDIRLNLTFHADVDKGFDHYLDCVLDLDEKYPHDHNDVSVYRYFSCSKWLEMYDVDYVVRMEHMLEDLDKHGLSCPRNVVMNPGNYEESWDSENKSERISKINAWARKDFENYGYEKL